MSRFHKLVTERFADHVARVRGSADPRDMKRHELKTKERTFGKLVAGLPAGSRVLDAGCGGGALLRWLSQHPGIMPVGVDCSPSQVEIARRALPGIEVHCEEAVPFLRRHPASFAGIFCMDVLEHLPEADDCLELAEAAREALVPGGFLVCGGPNAANIAGPYNRYMDVTHYRLLTDAFLFQLFDIAGFTRVRIVPHRDSRFIARVRGVVEFLLHRMLYLTWNPRISSGVFTAGICVEGFRPGAEGAATAGVR